MIRILIALSALCLSTPTLAEDLLVRGDRLYVAVEVGGERVDGLLDSGAEVTVLDEALAERLAIGGGTETEARGTGAGTSRARLVENLQVEALGRSMTLPVVAIIDLAEVAGRLTGGSLPLVLGRDVFDAGRLAIDIEAGTIDWVADQAEPGGVRLPLAAAHGIETMPVRFGETTVAADFDLGNGTGLLVAAELADRLGLEPAGMEPGGGIGGAAPRPVVFIPELTIAGKRFRHVRAHVSDKMQIPANVGVGLLRHFRIVTDFPARAVWLDPRADD